DRLPERRRSAQQRDEGAGSLGHRRGRPLGADDQRDRSVHAPQPRGVARHADGDERRMTGQENVGDVVLEARDIVKTYGGTRALRGVNFQVRRGTVTTLFGENGAGKSTLMKILSGVEQPTSGQIILDGAPVTFASTSEARDRGVSIIHQELSLAPNL